MSSFFSSSLRKWLPIGLAIAFSLSPHSWASESEARAHVMNSQAGSGWRAKSRDNICGLSNPRQVNQPAKVDYKQVLKSTPEMQDLARRNINPRSAEGQILRQRAVDRVRRASSMVMRSHGHCSLWRRISHKDGREVADLTSAVIASINAV